jgi:protein-disulfide isomerase
MKLLVGAALSAIFAMSLIATPIRAADAPTGATEPDAALVDAIINKMEQSGALDSAVDRAIGRYIKRREAGEEAKAQTELKERAKRARVVDVKRDHVRGNPQAGVTLIEYTDFECPFCKGFHATPKDLLDRYQGRLNWALRNFPLAFHDPAARKEALAGECVARLAGNDAYWKYADAVFASTRSNGNGLPEDKSVENLAESIGVKRPAMARCIKDATDVTRIEQDIADGKAAGVSGTPTTVVRNNRTGESEAVVGALSADALVPAIERMLNAKP